MKITVVSLVAALVAAQLTAAIHVEIARPAEADYSEYQSFGFRAQEGVPAEHPLGKDGVLFKELRDGASKILLSRGMTRVSGGKPDIWISFFGLTEEEFSVEGTSKKVGRVRWVGDPDAHSTQTVLHSTLIVEIWDASSDERVWSGWATSDSGDPAKARSRASKMVKKILEELPFE